MPKAFIDPNWEPPCNNGGAPSSFSRNTDTVASPSAKTMCSVGWRPEVSANRLCSTLTKPSGNWATRQAEWVTGTPAQVQAANFTVQATNLVGSTNATFDLQVFGPPVFTTTSPLPDGAVDAPYSAQILADYADSFSLFAGSLPDGLSLSGAGLVNGTPTNTGAFNFTVRATNDYGWSNRVFDLTILSQFPPRFSFIRATNGNVRLEWARSNVTDNVQVWRATNIVVTNVAWSNLGIQVSPWTNVAPPAPAYYQLRLAP